MDESVIVNGRRKNKWKSMTVLAERLETSRIRIMYFPNRKYILTLGKQCLSYQNQLTNIIKKASYVNDITV